ncbi:zinc finger and BTB domain-containing protein 44 isoform X2 [Paramormyrops kingsleyae]|uniref:Zinc finger and BTB domain-containing protein 44 n=2 Tax=Paramormyrops kingsleyae TaxID=1676925 RepID=A0A3B3Q4S2_9TELE|nr:zinc finger and BTB domain-containing protein 44 isoform X2 [Paramormyrops kingsleyae]XP_023672060.1 zinc finger and BTB domain-containing protein 44 isoform X2 [Paramormyrops kingsleyae]XP_023672061.1 zinc finger and BTB domain-containing protein 44 isoform X2 [Paramormyrops kingsleyae]
MGVKTFTHSSATHSQEMLEKLNALRNEGHFCDVTIRVQDKLFLAHKVVLACCSEFLRSKLVGRPDNDDKVVLDLHHVTVSGFTPLLEYAYTSTLSINTENIIDVLAAASYMQMFAVASTCSEFMKSSILWNASGGGGGAAQEKAPDATPEDAAGCTPTPQDGSLSPVSSECSVMERAIPVCRESRRKRKSFIVMSPESPLKCPASQAASPQVPHPSSFPDAGVQPVDSSLAFPWTFPFGVDRRFQSEKPKVPGSPHGLEQGASATDVARGLPDYLACEGPKTVVAASPLAGEEDVRVKVERLSDEEAHEEASQPVSASHSSLSDQQTVPGSEQVQEDLLISPQSSSIGSIDEGVAEGLPSIQGTSNASGHAEDDERLENVQYPYHLYISPSTRPGTNGPDRPFQCPTCGVRFTRIQNLKQHMLIHSGIKPFQCDRCGKKFTRAYSLKMHRLKHEGKRCFRCQICSATFTSFGEYKHHMRVSRHMIRKPRIYECKTCGAMFTNSGNLIVHLRSLNHEASELANYFQSSDFLVPDYLNQVQEEALGQYELAEQSFEGNSVQMPVISQVSSTQNCESAFSLAPPGALAAKEVEEDEEEVEEEETVSEAPKTSTGSSAETPKDGGSRMEALASLTIH